MVTWEWRDGIRSWVFPAFLASIMRAADFVGCNYLTAIRATLSLLSLSVVWFAYAWAKRASGVAAAAVAAGAAATWYELAIFAPRAFSEVIATDFLLPGLYLGMYGDRLEEKKRMFLAGLCCGLAMSLRVQLAPAAAVAALYFLRSNWRSRWPALAAGVLAPMLAFGLVDALTWGHPFQSFYLYYWENVVQRRSEIFGVLPWHWYLLILAEHFGLLLAFATVGIRRGRFLAWVALAMLATHMAIPHKEARFLYPMVPLVVTLTALGIVESAGWIGRRWKFPLPAAGIAAAGLGLFAFHSAYFAPQFGYWSRDSGTLAAFDRLSADPAVCGVGLYGAPWMEGGYAHLHRNVPIVIVPDEIGMAALAPSFNALVGVGRETPPDFKLRECRGGVCLYRRPGACAPPPPPFELNVALRLSGN